MGHCMGGLGRELRSRHLGQSVTGFLWVCQGEVGGGLEGISEAKGRTGRSFYLALFLGSPHCLETPVSSCTSC